MNPKIWIGIVVLVLILGGGAWFVLQRDRTPDTVTVPAGEGNSTKTNLTAADQAGLELSAQRCTGTDKPKLTHLPMNLEDFSVILPYGLVVGGHVTPIDHQYFSPTDFNSLPDTYNVYAMADAHLVSITTREHQGFGANAGNTVTDYRMVFTVSCRLLYYYDLVTSLAPDILAAYQAQGNNIDLPVTAGQLIGKIGGQTLDFAVWDTDHPLTNFIVPEHYQAESWKLYTADPLDYYTDDLKAQALSKYIRTVEPISGKIDYDVDGKLIGNWFQVGTNGYGGTQGEGPHSYWVGHLSIAPDYIDPTQYLISIGNWQPEARQFAFQEDGPDPAEVDVATGLVKYTLIGYREKQANGQEWSGMSFPVLPLTLNKHTSEHGGCFLVQMTGERTLTAQAFPGASCSAVNGFTADAVQYER